MSKETENVAARWFAPWSWATWDAAYALIVRAGEGDAAAKGALDAIKKNAAEGNAKAKAAKARFDAVAKLVAKGLAKPSEFVRSHRGQRPDQHSASLQRPGAAQAQARQQRQLEQQRRIAEVKRERERAVALRRAGHARLAVRRAETEEYEGRVEQLEGAIEQRRRQDELDAALSAQAERYEAELAKNQVPPASGLPEGDNENPAPVDIGPSGSAPGDVEFGE